MNMPAFSISALSIPTWIPLRRLAVLLGAAVLVLVPACIFVSLEKSANENLVRAESTAKARVELAPVIASLRARQASLKPLVGGAFALSMPKTLPAMVQTLQQLATDAGIDGARFMPSAESVVGEKGAIRLDGRFNASADSLRRFIVLLSDQDWIHAIGNVGIAAASPTPECTMTLRATFSALVNGSRAGNGSQKAQQ